MTKAAFKKNTLLTSKSQPNLQKQVVKC
jgi:hypothetical protein